MIDPTRLENLLADLVRINSVNPYLVPGVPGEGAIAGYLVDFCRAAGLDAEIQDTAAGGPNVIARIQGRGKCAPLLLNGHLDTVSVEGMAGDPFAAEVKDGRLYGRGAFDMKGGVAAMVEAATAVAAGGPPPGDVILTMVADEEYASQGTQAVVRWLQQPRSPRVGAAVVTEPTALEVVVAHKGFAWLTIETMGRAAHGSRHEEGIDAITRMGRVLAALDRLERAVLPARRHPLLGRPSVHASLIEGGNGLSTYPDRCRLQIERRTLPGEARHDIEAEMTAVLEVLRAEDPAFEASWHLDLFRPGLEVAPDQPIVRTVLRAAEEVLGRTPALLGEAAWLDSALLAAAGIPTVIFGPAGAGAHAAVEWVDLDSVTAAARVLAAVMRSDDRG